MPNWEFYTSGKMSGPKAGGKGEYSGADLHLSEKKTEEIARNLGVKSVDETMHIGRGDAGPGLDMSGTSDEVARRNLGIE